MFYSKAVLVLCNSWMRTFERKNFKLVKHELKQIETNLAEATTKNRFFSGIYSVYCRNNNSTA